MRRFWRQSRRAELISLRHFLRSSHPGSGKMVGPTSGLPGSFAMERGGEVWPAWRRVPRLAAVQEGLGVGARLSAGVAAGARGCRALCLHRPPRPCGSSLTWVAVLAGNWFPASVHTRIMPKSDLWLRAAGIKALLWTSCCLGYWVCGFIFLSAKWQ